MARKILQHKKLPHEKKISFEEIQDRIVLRMLNEAVWCLQEGILSQPMDGDIGAVFGLGFPPFRGGPFRMIDIVGAQNICNKLEKYATSCGKRFLPAPLLVDYARTKRKFYA